MHQQRRLCRHRQGIRGQEDGHAMANLAGAALAAVAVVICAGGGQSFIPVMRASIGLMAG